MHVHKLNRIDQIRNAVPYLRATKLRGTTRNISFTYNILQLNFWCSQEIAVGVVFKLCAWCPMNTGSTSGRGQFCGRNSVLFSRYRGLIPQGAATGSAKLITCLQLVSPYPQIPLWPAHRHHLQLTSCILFLYS